MLGIKPVIVALLINAIYLIVGRGFVGVIPYLMAFACLIIFISIERVLYLSSFWQGL